MAMKTPSAVGQFAIRHRLAIAFVSVALCLGGIYAAFHLPSSVFPQTNFPRVVIMVDNGVMPADEMMATVTRPIEEAMKEIPGSIQTRSITGRGSAAISVFFTWSADMIQAELQVNARLSQESRQHARPVDADLTERAWLTMSQRLEADSYRRRQRDYLRGNQAA